MWWWLFIGTVLVYLLLSKGVYRNRALEPTWLFVAGTLIFEFWGLVILLSGIEGKSGTAWSVVGIVAGAFWIAVTTLSAFSGRAHRRELRRSATASDLN